MSARLGARRSQVVRSETSDDLRFSTRPSKYASEFHDFSFSWFHLSQTSLKSLRETNERKTFIILKQKKENPETSPKRFTPEDFLKLQKQQKVSAIEGRR